MVRRMWQQLVWVLVTVVSLPAKALLNTTSVNLDSAPRDGGSDNTNNTLTMETRVEVGLFNPVSGIRPWVDPDTPADKQYYISSRGDKWELVMSDEFGDTSRNFTPGKDYLWTSLEKPDGVNGAVQLYSHDMTYVECDKAQDGSSARTCYLVIKIIDEVNTVRVYNQYSRPAGFQDAKFFYRAAMLQTWNKFCFQGGMVEVRAQLPGAVGNAARNPDLKGNNRRARAKTNAFYPTWPGIWMMGNLGRAIFSASTNRMWPYSYNECNPRVFNPKNQRISACDSDPGHGLNPNQGRGAPEIDLLEGGGSAISSSIQIGPGLKKKFRMLPPNTTLYTQDNAYCFYSYDCTTPGANVPNVPSFLYKKRGYQTWYKGLRYGANNECEPDASELQRFETIKNALAANLTENKCSVTTCPGSNDVQSDLGWIDGESRKGRWGINSNGTCFAIMNGYMGTYLCDPDNTDSNCQLPRNASTPRSNVMEPFNYQMDALSANWGIQVGAYLDYLTYQVEWTMGNEGYVRWMLAGNPVYEIPAAAVINVPQDKDQSSPQLTFPEEPMYLILNVALSQQWGTTPPNVGKPCRGDGKDPVTNRICESFPMYMKIDYVRLYQDTSPNSTMAIGCNPKTHPTRRWIEDHLDEYQDDINRAIDVEGGAKCRSDRDCTIAPTRLIRFRTGECVLGRCVCSTAFWGGPRCTSQLEGAVGTSGSTMSIFGPPLFLTLGFGGAAIVVIGIMFVVGRRRRRVKFENLQRSAERKKGRVSIDGNDDCDDDGFLLADMNESRMPHRGATGHGSMMVAPAAGVDEIELTRLNAATPRYEYKQMTDK